MSAVSQVAEYELKTKKYVRIWGEGAGKKFDKTNVDTDWGNMSFFCE
jgi:hypothetical protein